MSTNENNQQEANAQTKTPTVKLRRQYIKDLSLESFDATVSINGEQPNIKVEVNVQAQKAEDQEDLFAVILKGGIQAQNANDEKFLILELEYTGEFVIKDVPEEHMKPVLLVTCAQTLFPYFVRLIRDVTSESAHNPITLDHIDFATLYVQNEQKQTDNNQQGNIV